MKGKIYLLLATWLCLSLSGFAENYSGNVNENITWSLDTSTGLLTLTGTGNMPKFSYVWNSQNMAPWEEHKSAITQINVGEGITSLDEFNFFHTENVTAISLPSTLTSIGYQCFYECYKLESLVIPASVTTIGKEAFANDTSLVSLTLPERLTSLNRCVLNCPKLERLHLPATLTDLGEAYDIVFENCPLLQLTMDEGNTTYALENNCLYTADKTKILWAYKQATSVDIPTTVTSIHRSAFTGGKLTAIDIPASVNSIGYNAFNGCQQLKTAHVAGYIQNQESGVFSDCTALESATYTEGANKFHITFQNCSSLKTASLGKSTQEELSNTFYNCPSLTDVSLPENVQSLYYTFGDCSALGSITLPQSVKSIKYAFAGCTSLSDVQLPDSVNNVEGAFKHCTSLEKITLPEGITSLSYTFENCTNLKEVNIPSSVVTLNYAFYNCPNLEMPNLVIRNVKNMAYAFFGCKKIKTVDLDIWVENMNRAFYRCDSLTDVTVASMKPVEMADGAFSGVAMKNAILHLPYGASAAYAQNNDWNFVNMIEDHEPITVRATGILGSIKWTISDDWVLTIKPSYENSTGYMTSFHSEANARYDYYGDGSTDDNENYAKYPWYEYRNSIVEVYVDKMVKHLGWGCFANMRNLTKITLPSWNLSTISDFYENQVENCFGALFARKMVKRETSTQNSRFTHIYYTFNLLNLKEIVLTGSSVDMYGFVQYKQNWSYEKENNYGSKNTYGRYEYYDAPELAGLNIVFEDVNEIAHMFAQQFVNAVVSLNYSGDTMLPKQSLRFLSGLKYLKMKGTGAANGSTTFALNSLFGQSAVDGATLINGYYMPSLLEEVVVAEGPTNIPDGAFKDITTLKRITLPATLTAVGDEAFYGCNGLTDLYVNSAFPPVAYANSFTGVSRYYCKLHVPTDSKRFYEGDDYWKYFYFIETDANVNITVKKNIENAGVVTGLTSYNNGETASFLAVPNGGYRFVVWLNEQGDTLSTRNELFFTATCDSTILAVFAPIMNSDDVTTETTETTVTLTWTCEEGAATYVVSVYADAAMKELVKTITCDAQGNVISIQSVGYASAYDNKLDVTVEGLEDGKRYFYAVSAYNEEEELIGMDTGYFSTPAFPEGIETAELQAGPELTVNAQGLTVSRTTQPVAVYSVSGQLIDRLQGGSSATFHLPAGLYIVRSGSWSSKVSVK